MAFKRFAAVTIPFLAFCFFTIFQCCLGLLEDEGWNENVPLKLTDASRYGWGDSPLNFQVIPLWVDYPVANRQGQKADSALGSQNILQFGAYNLTQLILGAFFVLIGFMTILIFVPGLEIKAILAFGLLSVATGIFILSQTRQAQSIFAGTRPLLYIAFVSLNFIPITLCYFFEQVFSAGYKGLVRRFWQIHSVYLVLALLLSVSQLINIVSAFTPFFTLFFIVIIFLMGTSIQEGMRGNPQAKIFTVGILLLGSFCAYDIITALGGSYPWRLYHHWGMFLFVLSLGIILKQHFVETQVRLKANAKELEALSTNLKWSYQKLEEHSRNLEKTVAERTHDLNQKNIQLSETLRHVQEMQNQLLMKEKMASLGHLVAGVAHELNNPLGAINSAANVINRGIHKITSILENTEYDQPNSQIRKLSNTLRENNRVIAQAGNRITTIVKSLKSFANLDEAEYKKVDIHECIDNVLTLMEYHLKNKIKVVKDYGKIPDIFCYCNLLNQVFMNLLKNAIQAIPDSGNIHIRTFAKEQSVHILISDTGVGIPAEKLERIFEFDFSADDSRKKLGMGLPTVYNIIKKHHGEIRVESEIGQGSKFEVILPVKNLSISS